jgi:oligoendopeptidase F
MHITLNIHHHTRDDLYPYAQDLSERERISAQDFLDWIHDRELFESFTGEAYAIRYNAYSCDTRTPELKERLDTYEKEIHPKLQELTDQLNRRCVDSPRFGQLPSDYGQRAKCIAMDIKLFKPENIPLFTQDQELSHQYSKIKSEQTIEHDDRTQTLQQAAEYMKNKDRTVRKEVFDKICKTRAQDAEKTDQILDALIQLRTQIAHNAGYANYRDYVFDAKHRFDYIPADCERFHHTVEHVIKPLYGQLLEKRKSQIGVEKLTPYDLEVDPLGREPLPKFPNVNTMIEKTAQCLNKIDPEFGALLQKLKKENNLDL